MAVSSDQKLLDKVAFLGVQAKTDPLYFIHDEIGYNYRMPNIQAAFGTDQIDRLEGFIKTTINNYKLYKEAIEDIEVLTLLLFREDTRANHWFYSLIVDKEKYGIDRNELLWKLNDKNIQTRPLWRLMHKQKPYLGSQTYKIKKADFYEKNLINISCSSNLMANEVLKVIDMLKSFKS